jgi:hypothetical protein
MVEPVEERSLDPRGEPGLVEEREHLIVIHARELVLVNVAMLVLVLIASRSRAPVTSPRPVAISTFVLKLFARILQVGHFANCAYPFLANFRGPNRVVIVLRLSRATSS